MPGGRLPRMHPYRLRHTLSPACLTLALTCLTFRSPPATPTPDYHALRPGRKNLDRHLNYTLAAYMAFGACRTPVLPMSGCEAYGTRAHRRTAVIDAALRQVLRTIAACTGRLFSILGVAPAMLHASSYPSGGALHVELVASPAPAVVDDSP